MAERLRSINHWHGARYALSLFKMRFSTTVAKAILMPEMQSALVKSYRNSTGCIGHRLSQPMP